MMKEKYNLPSQSNDSSNITEPKITTSSLRVPEGGYSNPCSPAEDELSDVSLKDSEDEESTSTRIPKSFTLPKTKDNREPAVSYKPRNSEVEIIEPRVSNNHQPLPRHIHGKHNPQEGSCNCPDPQNKYIPPQYDEEGNCCPCCPRLGKKWQNCSRVKRRATRLGLAGMIIILSTILGLALYSKKEYFVHIFETNYTTVCDTSDCILAAADILTSINPSVSPCDDFYKFSCGGWQENNPNPPTMGSWNRFSNVVDKLHFRIKGILENSSVENESRSFTNARKMYKACINQSHWDSVGVKPLLKLLKDLGGFPVIEEVWNDKEFDWLKTIAILHKKFGAFRLLSVFIGQDEKDSSKKSLYLDQGPLVTNLILIAQNDSVSRYFEKKWMKRVINTLLQAKNYDNELSDDKDTTEPTSLTTTTSTPSYNNTNTTTEHNFVNESTTLPFISDENETQSSIQIDNPSVDPFLSILNETLTSSAYVESLNSSDKDFNLKSALQPHHELDSISSESPGNDTKFSQDEMVKENPVLKFENVTDEDDIETDGDIKQQSRNIKIVNEDVRHLLMMEMLPIRKLIGNDNKLERKRLLRSTDQIDKDVEDVWNFYVELAQIMEQYEYLQPEEERYNPMTIKELMKLSPQSKGNINWFEFFQILFEDTQTEVTEDFRLIVVQPKFFHKLPNLIQNTPNRVIANSLLYLLLIEVGQEVSPNLRSFNKKTNNARYIGRTSPRPWFDCVDKVMAYMEHIVANLYLKRNYDSFKEDADVVKKLVDHFSDDLISTLNMSSWMDESTRKEAVKKVVEMTDMIGFTPQFLDETTIEAAYFHFPEMSENDHFSNMLYAAKYYSEMAFNNFNRPPPSRKSWSINTLDVNAIYSVHKNSIQIPSGILQQPFYRRNTIIPLLYGSIGMIIGHEILHGFDVNGRTRNWKGDLFTWWSNNSLRKYEEISACYEQQYNLLPVKQVLYDENGEVLKVDGIRTKAENIADNEGISLAWRVYKKINDFGDQRIKGLEMYSSDQLFFITVAQMWCANYDPYYLEDHLKYGSHTPEPFRVNGVVRNNPDFAKAFNCGKESQMVAVKKCKLW